MADWPNVSDEAAIRYALSQIMTWQELGETGGPSLQDAADLVVTRVAEAREARAATVQMGDARAVTQGDLVVGMTVQRSGTVLTERAPGRAVVHLERITHKASVVLAVKVGAGVELQMIELRPGHEFYIELPPVEQ